MEEENKKNTEEKEEMMGDINENKEEVTEESIKVEDEEETKKPEKTPKEKISFGEWYDKNYKKLLLIPLLIVLISVFLMFNFYQQHGDFFIKDVSLTGGTTVTIFEKIDSNELKQSLSTELNDLNIREISDVLTSEQIGIIIETQTEVEEATLIIESYLGFELTEENSSIEFTGSSLSESFYQQLIFAVLVAFLFMGFVVFLIFGKGFKIKFLTGTLTLLPAILFFTKSVNIGVASIIILSAFIINLYLYYKHSIPSMAVIISAFADIFLTLSLVNLLGIRMSSAGIVALLMLIGYSVDSDIMLTNRLLKRQGEDSINKRIFYSFKTGLTMALTSMVAFMVALFIVKSFSEILTQIFTILIIGLSFDIMNTWITNTSILKWYLEHKQNQ